ncbi:MAG: hypothetical protein ABR529_05500 [Actinomycetota bacterium]
MSNDKLLRIYLTDHLAGAAGGVELAKRCLSSNKENALGGYLETHLIPAILEDKRSLESLMERLRVPRARWKQAAARSAEKAGRLKLNGRVTGYSPLSRLVEIEGMCLGIEGKGSLWHSLKHISGSSQALRDVDLDRLIERARRQREELESHRLDAAERALASSMH